MICRCESYEGCTKQKDAFVYDSDVLSFCHVLLEGLECQYCGMNWEVLFSVVAGLEYVPDRIFGSSAEKEFWERDIQDVFSRGFFPQYAVKRGYQDYVFCDFADAFGNVLEVDGPLHNEAKQKDKDARKDEFLKSKGFTVERIKAYKYRGWQFKDAKGRRL